MLIILGYASVCFAAAMILLYRVQRNRPDRKLAREVRECGKNIKKTITSIRLLEAHISEIRAPEYASRLRAEGWVDGDGGEHEWHVKPTSDGQVKQRIDDEMNFVGQELKSEYLRLRGQQETWSALVDKYRAQNNLFDASSDLRKQMSSKEQRIVKLQKELAKAEDEKRILQREIDRIETDTTTYRQGAMRKLPIKVRVAPEFSEIEALLEKEEVAQKAKKTA